VVGDSEAVATALTLTGGADCGLCLICRDLPRRRPSWPGFQKRKLVGMRPGARCLILHSTCRRLASAAQERRTAPELKLTALGRGRLPLRCADRIGRERLATLPNTLQRRVRGLSRLNAVKQWPQAGWPAGHPDFLGRSCCRSSGWMKCWSYHPRPLPPCGSAGRCGSRSSCAIKVDRDPAIHNPLVIEARLHRAVSAPYCRPAPVPTLPAHVGRAAVYRPG